MSLHLYKGYHPAHSSNDPVQALKMCKEAIGDDELSVGRQLCTAPEYGVAVSILYTRVSRTDLAAQGSSSEARQLSGAK